MFTSHTLKMPFCLAAITALMGSACSTNSSNIGFGGGVGTTGITAEAKAAVSNRMVLRGNVNILPISRNETFDGVDYEADIDMTTVGGFVDLYPMPNSGLNISGGVYGGKKALDLVGVPGAATAVNIGNTTYTGAQIGTLRGSVEYSDISPYLGIGYDGFMNRSRQWSFNARAGVMFVGKPDVRLTAEGGLVSATPGVQAELQNEIDNLQDELDKYEFYPVVSLGMTRRF